MKKQRKHFALRNRRSRGMSLIQIVVLIVVVIGIIGLIAAAVGVNVMRSCPGPARQDRAELEIKDIEIALTLYKVKKGQYPDPGAGLKVLVDSEDLKEIPLDPWGGEYDYRLEGDKPVIISYGADKAPGGEGEDADIFSKT